MKRVFYKTGNQHAKNLAMSFIENNAGVVIKETDMSDLIQLVSDNNEIITGNDALAIITSLGTRVSTPVYNNPNISSSIPRTRLRILVTALYVRGMVREGGSSFYMKCIIDNLRKMGYDVVASAKPEEVIHEDFDLIICSHNRILNKIKNHPAPKICISQGIIGEEILHKGAQLYYSVSEEARNRNIQEGIDSSVIGQPVDQNKILHVNKTLKNILIIRNNASGKDDPFKCLSSKYTVKNSDPNIPIEEQIKWADLCITLGRGAVSAMSLGRMVLVADNRGYIGRVGDGYLDGKTVYEIAKHNFSGRKYKYPITDEWLLSEVAKYNPEDATVLHEYVAKHHNITTALKRMLDDVTPLLGNASHLVSNNTRRNVYGLLRIRNESKIIKDTLDHMSTFCKGIFVYDDCSDDNTFDICNSHPSVIKSIRGESWSIDRLAEEFKNRQAVLDLARNNVEPDSWFIYMDADERIDMDWDDFHMKQHNFDMVTMRLWDFYITEEDKNKPYTERRWIGPEYRDIKFMFRNHPQLKYWIPDQRECSTPAHYRNVNMGSVKHYGKAIDIEEWESTCDYYIEHFAKYREKWKARKGKAIHTVSDFNRKLILWEDRYEKGVKL